MGGAQRSRRVKVEIGLPLSAQQSHIRLKRQAEMVRVRAPNEAQVEQMSAPQTAYSHASHSMAETS